jgi:hypothetical protein
VKVFTQWALRAALAHAAAGGQAVHCHRVIVDRSRAPRCFVAAVDRGEDIAHLFDRDKARLEATARRLGVRVVVVEHEGLPGQHVDLCGAPLSRALVEARREAKVGRQALLEWGEPPAGEDKPS